MHIKPSQITPKNIASFVRGTSKKLADDLKLVKVPEHERVQIEFRKTLCSDCLELGACKSCHCKTPDMFYDPLKEDALGKWGKMMSKSKLEEFLTEHPIVNTTSEEYTNIAKTYGQMTASQPKMIGLTSEQSSKDLGIITMDPIEVEYEYTNILDQPLTIANIVPGCGCTAPEWNREPVAPGETFKIKLVFTPQTEGAFYKTASIVYTDPNVLQNVLVLQGTAETKPGIKDERLTIEIDKSYFPS